VTTPSLITRRVDHIMIRVVDPIYDQLFSFLSQKLQLPLSWPIIDSIPGFKTGGVFAGNISMEIFQSGAEQTLLSPAPSQAQLYGTICSCNGCTRGRQEGHRPFAIDPGARALSPRDDGQYVNPPLLWQLAWMRSAEGLTDRQAADAVRG